MSAARILPLLTAALIAACERKVDAIAQSEQVNATASTATPFRDRRVTNPFPGATEVRLFVEVSYTNANKPILNKAKGVLLNAAQRKAFEDGLVITAAPDTMDACFIPHHFFRYYDSEGKKVGEIAVCFCCEGVSASGSQVLETPDHAMVSADYARLKALVTALGEPTDILCD